MLSWRSPAQPGVLRPTITSDTRVGRSSFIPRSFWTDRTVYVGRTAVIVSTHRTAGNPNPAGLRSFATIRTVRRPATAARARSRRGLLTALVVCAAATATAVYWLATSTHDRRLNVLLI